MNFFFYTALALFIFLSAFLCLLILIQESKSLGLGASFGGDPGESVFGTSTAAVLKKVTAWLGVIFVIACLILSFWSVKIAMPMDIENPSTIEELNS